MGEQEGEGTGGRKERGGGVGLTIVIGEEQSVGGIKMHQ